MTAAFELLQVIVLNFMIIVSFAGVKNPIKAFYTPAIEF